MKGYRKVHHIAQCEQCNWDDDDYHNKFVGREATKHHKKTGHTIIIEIGLSRRLEALKKRGEK